MDDRSATRMEVATAVLLSAAGLLSAWAAFQAALWGGVQATAYAESTKIGTEAARLDLEAGQERGTKAALVHAWLDAAATGDRRRMTFYESHLSLQQRQVFLQWRAKLPADLSRLQPAPGQAPLPLPPIIQPGDAAAAKARTEAADKLVEGQTANATGDRFVFATVILSMVLFLAGIAQLLRQRVPRIAVLSLAAILMAVSIVYLAAIPVAEF